MSGFQMPISINHAMQYIDSNYYVLPAFQRDFVWSEEQIEKLFDSLMRGYPTSSMLFWNVRGETKTSGNCNIKLSMFSVRTNLCYMIYPDFDRIAADLKLVPSTAFG